MNKCFVVRDLYRQVSDVVPEGFCGKGKYRAVYAVLTGGSGDVDQMREGLGRWVKGLEQERLFVLVGDADVLALGDPDEGTRTATCAAVSRLIGVVGGLAEETGVIVGAQRAGEIGGSYEDVFNHIYGSVCGLVRAAEQQRVTLCVENPGRGMFLSPLEFRDFVDQVNNAYMGVCFNPVNASGLGDACDWFETLGPRVAVVRIPQSEHNEMTESMRTFLRYLADRKFDRPVIVGVSGQR